MKTKFFFSTLALAFFALIAGGSVDVVGNIFTVIFWIIGVIIVISIIALIVQNLNKKKRLKMIKEDEEKSSDFDRSVFIGDDRGKLYFDSSKKQVLIMRVMTEGIKKEYIDNFEYPGKNFAIYNNSIFNVFDPKRRKLITGSFNSQGIVSQVVSLEEKDFNKNATINSCILPFFRSVDSTVVLIDESHAQMAITESGNIRTILNYIVEKAMPRKTGNKSFITTKVVGKYLFIMDDFFKALVLITPGSHKIFNYSDIIDVTYEEDGTQLYSKSAGRTVGGAIVGGVLMGGAGAIVGGLTGDSTKNKEVRSMDIKLLLRSTKESSYVLHFNEFSVLKTKEEGDKKLYDKYLKNADEAKDIFSVIIDNVKQSSAPAPQSSQPTQSSQPSQSNQNAGIADELGKLAKLKADGILTEEEFQTQKAKLLGL